MSDTTQQPLELKDIPIVTTDKLKKVTVAASFGNAVEWFDFSIYGFLAVIMGQVFFSPAPQSVQLVASLATFSIPFLFRPLGGLIFSVIGDKFGRKRVLTLTIIIMSLSTASIGIIPGYETIGFMAPVLLLLAKIAQGLSVGGEYSGAAVFLAEYSPDRKRGFLASWLDFGSLAGFLVGAIVIAILTNILGSEALENWGWRIPFILSLPLGLIGIYMRKSLDETPAYENQAEQDRDNVSTVGEIIKNNWRNIVVCCCIVILTNTTYYMLLTYMPNYLSTNLHFETSQSVFIIIVVMTGLLIMQPFIGALSDKIGRKPIQLFGSIMLFVWAIPAFWMIKHDSVMFIGAGIAILALILGCFIATVAATLPALFPIEVRFRTLAISFNVSVLIAGVTPPLAAWLVEETGSLYVPAYYLMVVSILGFVASVMAQETAKKPLMDSPPVASSRVEARQLLKDHYDSIEENIADIDDKIMQLVEARQNLIDQHPKMN